MSSLRHIQASVTTLPEVLRSLGRTPSFASSPAFQSVNFFSYSPGWISPSSPRL
ncbi:MAG: hypothetical protein H7A49_11860 [Akkermansiaceae bacterium]|nr:hypothetical protein [Akkermansiaceae bacterium]